MSEVRCVLSTGFVVPQEGSDGEISPFPKIPMKKVFFENYSCGYSTKSRAEANAIQMVIHALYVEGLAYPSQAGEVRKLSISPTGGGDR